jgi:hypothetical protein
MAGDVANQYRVGKSKASQPNLLPIMITNLLFTALCLAIALLVSADVRAPRAIRVKVRRDDGHRRG